jgi:hypothetical protein
MKDQRDLDFEQSMRQIAQWADRQVHTRKRSKVRHFAATVGGSIFYVLIASLVLLALLGLVRHVT